MPFPVLKIHPDNGSEFFNDHLERFFREQVKVPELTRSRPYHKNDNRFVEQKSSTLKREPLGYARFDTVSQTQAINQLSEMMWLYYNFFQPVMRVAEKFSIPTDHGNVRIKRRYDQARTPLDRLCVTEVISSAQKEQLLALSDQTNLRQAILEQIIAIFRLPNAEPGVTEDILHTLAQPISIPKGEDAPVTLLFDLITAPRYH